MTVSHLPRVLLGSLLALVLVAGSAFLWIGVPLLGFWFAGTITSSSQAYLFVVLGGIPVAMIGWGWLLYRLNGVYERLDGDAQRRAERSSWLVSQSDERGELRRARAPRSLIDVAMTASAVTALVVLLVWFFFLAEMNLVSQP